MRETIRRDTQENWEKAKNFIPKENEIIIYDCADGPKVKVGDGKTRVNNIPFNDAITMDITNSSEVKDEILII